MFPSVGFGMGEPDDRQLVFIVASFEPDLGGDVRLVANQARTLVRRGWDVTVLTRHPDERAPRQEFLDGLRVVRRGRRGRRRRDTVAALLGWTAWLLRRRRTVTAVHVVMHPDYLIPALVCGLLNRSVLQWITDGDVARSLGWRDGRLRALQIRVRRWLTARTVNVSLTETMSQELNEVGVSPGEVIPLGVDTNRFQAPDSMDRAAERSGRGLMPEDVVILFVGHLEPRKGIDLLIQAVAQLRKSCPWQLWIVGDDHPGLSYSRALKSLAARRDVQTRVKFIGAVREVESCFRIADVFAIASEREGLPNVLLEAMAHGLPCVAPFSAGGGELLAGGAGSVPQTNRPDEMASELRALVDDSRLRDRLGSRARAAVQRYSLAVVADSYELIYHELPTAGQRSHRRISSVHTPRPRTSRTSS